jgi:hypothetical protein
MPRTWTVGVISDTHGLVRPEAVAALSGADHIVHAGDVGAPEVIEALASIAPVTAVCGNNDRGAWAKHLPATARLSIGDVRLLVLHDLAELDRLSLAADVVISGHSHRPANERRDGVLYLNPGSAGPRRFRLPVAVARLVIRRTAARTTLSAEVCLLDVGLPTPA